MNCDPITSWMLTAEFFFVLLGSGDTVHVYEILAVVFWGAGTEMDRSSSVETLKVIVSESAGLSMLESYKYENDFV